MHHGVSTRAIISKIVLRNSAPDDRSRSSESIDKTNYGHGVSSSCRLSILSFVLTHTLGMILISFALVLLSVPALSDTDPIGVFTSPYSTGFGEGYGSNLVWPLGSRQTVAWNTTLSTYNVTLWQQSTTENRARVASSPVFS
jgi:hypothetical protein